MNYKKKNYLIEGIRANQIVKKYKTPSYCYSYKRIRENINFFKKNFQKINPLTCFAVKANPNRAILKEIGKLGMGADVVSIGELMKAIKSGIKVKIGHYKKTILQREGLSKKIKLLMEKLLSL